VKASDRELKAKWKADQRAAAEAALPLPRQALDDLAAELDRRLSEQDCDHSLRITTEWARRRATDLAALLSWAQSRGGYCDCEVLNNALDEDQV